MNIRSLAGITALITPVLSLLGGLGGSSPATAANHREAPLTAFDHKADITDVFAFVSYDDPEKVTLILDVDPLLEPSNGPTHFPFDPEIIYSIKVDNNHDALEDVSFEFRFNTEIRLPGVFTGLVGAGDGVDAPANSPSPVPPGTPIVPPAITALDGPGSEGLGLRQNYRVTLVKGRGFFSRRFRLAQGLYAVPTNVGPRTMPNYPALFSQGVHTLGDLNDLGEGVRVFAGTVEDPFWIDLGAAFDSLNFRPAAFGTGVPGVLDDVQDGTDDLNFAPDDVAGFNVNAIAIEVPTRLLTADGELHAADDPLATLGIWGTTSRPRVKAYGQPGEQPTLSRDTVQIQRMGNPLFNELLIGVGSKDHFSRSQPADDAQFADFALDPVLARVLNAVYGGAVEVPDAPRLDLLPLVQYLPPIAAPGTPAGPVADLLRLNTGIAATPMVDRSRLGLLAGDAAGYPNGRRLSDDVVDIATRVVAGVLAGPDFNRFPNNQIGDGVNTNDATYGETFPYLAPAHSGVESRHVDPSETGCTGFCP